MPGTQRPVAPREQVWAFTDAAESELGPIDAVVTSAEAVRDNPLVRMTGKDWGDAMATNLDGVQLGHFGAPDDVADLVSVFVSGRARHISGQVLGVDGGLVIGAPPSPIHRS